jgi:hypothetical protein
MVRVTTLIAVIALAACANTGDEGMIVLNNTAVGSSCTLSGTTSQPFIAHGEIFARSPTGYVLTPLIQSRVMSASSVDDSQRTIFLSGANISLEVKAVSIERADGSFVNGPAITLAQPQFSTLFSASLPPSGTVNVGFEMIPPQALRQILSASGAGATDSMRAEVLATVNILGTLGGDEIESAPFSFPVSVCNNCVVNIVGTCPLPSGTPVRTGNACNAFQDGAVDCCLNGDSAICPATVATSLQ